MRTFSCDNFFPQWGGSIIHETLDKTENNLLALLVWHLSFFLELQTHWEIFSHKTRLWSDFVSTFPLDVYNGYR